MILLTLFLIFTFLLFNLLYQFGPSGNYRLKLLYPNYVNLNKCFFYNHKTLYRNVVNLKVKGRKKLTSHYFLNSITICLLNMCINQLIFILPITDHFAMIVAFALLVRTTFGLLQNMVILIVVNLFPKKLKLLASLSGILGSLKHLASGLFIVVLILSFILGGNYA